jgi:amidohydrolase
MNGLYHEALELFEYSQQLRRDFHRHPELGFREMWTSGVIARELGQIGLEVSTKVAKTGVVALLEGNHPGPVVLLRFDMDALPIQEENSIDYASQVPGVMHACGHDGHMAIGITVARVLKNHHMDFNGTVKLVFQPAEEGLGGSVKMISEGVLENPKPDYALAMHLWNECQVGTVALVPGPFLAGSTSFKIIISGRGGHGALPQQTVDPVLAGAHLVTAIQSIVSRNVSPLDTAVISVTQFHAGDAFNVIPKTAELKGTLRFFKNETRSLLIERISHLSIDICAAMGCTAEVVYSEMTPAVNNNPEVTRKLAAAFKKTIPDMAINSEFHTMVSEDMAFFLEEVPGCLFMVGSANPERGIVYGHHHPKFDFDETAIPRGAALMAASALELLS